MSTAHELPNLPVLPPLEMPSHKEPAPITLPVPVKRDSATFLKSPALSFAESFSTAYTSPGDDGGDSARFIGPSSLAPPQNLRKSISVDSFAQYGRDSSRAVRGYTNTSPDPYSSFNEAPSVTDEPVWSGRHRGESLSSIKADNATSSLDSDVDRYDPLDMPPTERFRHLSLKNQDLPKTFVRGGDLPLPPRVQNNSLTPSVNSVATASTTSGSRETLRSIPSTSSLQHSSRRGNSYAVANSGRSRSGSLGMNVTNTFKRAVNSPQAPLPHRGSISKKDIVIVVIGTTGCGKSTVIKEGLAGYGLKRSSNTSGLPLHVRRTCQVKIDDPDYAFTSPQNIEVIEVEVQTTNNGLLKWPQALPPLDGLIICYDSSDKKSYQSVEGLLKGYRSMILPIMVLACKADLQHQIEPSDVSRMLKEYDAGLIETSTVDGRKEKMKQSFAYMLMAVLRQRGPNRIIDNQNPASPKLAHTGAPWEKFESNTPNTSPSIPSPILLNSSISKLSDSNAPSPLKLAPSLTSTRARSTAELAYDDVILNSHVEETLDVGVEDTEEIPHPHPTSDSVENSPGLLEDSAQQILDEKKNGAKKEPRPSQWADLDELLEKLLFLAISGDEPTFTTHFLLTYRRFATPRSVLLAMQKRMRQLDNPCGDPMFACFAQMRICHLLETWIHDYPHDFAVKGTAGALNALIKSIISKTHLLHYGSEFLPFLEQLPSLVDQDFAWALKAEVADNDSDDYTPEDDDDDDTRVDHSDSVKGVKSNKTHVGSSKVTFPSRERKPSLPLPKALLSPSQANGTHHYSHNPSPKQQIRELVKLAEEVRNTNPVQIAQEITRQGVRRFLEIKPRDWLQYTFVSGKKSEGEPIIAFNEMANHLAEWVVSLILCHDRPRLRVKQIEKFVEIAQALRQMNNYSALRAFVAGINNANDDSTMDMLKMKAIDKSLMSWDLLLQQIRGHRAYRLALRNSKGACIPALEVHMSDLIRSHEGNGDSKSSDPTKIHWGKFNMMGRFITGTLQCQAQCRNSTDYNFPERCDIAELFVKLPVMSNEMQKSRLKSQDYDFDDVPPSIAIQPKDAVGLRKLFFW
ncbi:ras guanine nucleotide exchange factor domain-containing protein [Crassisporium funariophilum]|nr:ras guanine nucleotide exchange factor domain-containing protein [Crassisporium funariophilum]